MRVHLDVKVFPIRKLALPSALFFFAAFAAAPAGATLVPRLSFEQLVEGSRAIVHGTVLRSWTGWDSTQTAIWTHYEIRVVDMLKGGRLGSIVVSEPGGEVDGVHMQVVGAPRYAIGEEVVLFAARAANGYLRTCGWGQGKFQVREASADAGSGKLVRAVLGGVELIGPIRGEGRPPRKAGVSLKTFDGLDLEAFKARIRQAVSAPPAERNR